MFGKAHCEVIYINLHIEVKCSINRSFSVVYIRIIKDLMNDRFIAMNCVCLSILLSAIFCILIAETSCYACYFVFCSIKQVVTSAVPLPSLSNSATKMIYP